MTQTNFTAVDFDPFAEGEILLTVPATESQKEIWASVQLGDEANLAYNESVSLKIKGNLDLDLFKQAINQIIQRHEALRSTFSKDGAQLCIAPSLNLEIPVIDLTNLTTEERQDQINNYQKAVVEEVFNLEQGPLFKVKIIQAQSQEFTVIITAHHIIFDGWSWGVLISELGKIYGALKQGITPVLEPVESFKDYAVGKQKNKESEQEKITEEFWLQQFANSIPLLDFPTDRPRPALRSFNAAREDWILSAQLVKNLRQFGAKNGCSFMTTLLTAFEVFIKRITGQDDFCVGIAAAGQASAGKYNLIGHCVHLLPIRTNVDANLTFADYLKARKKPILDAYDHQEFTFGSLIQKLKITRDPSRIPLVPIVFNIDQELDGKSFDFGDLELEVISNPRSFETFEIFINAAVIGEGIVLECQYNTNLFDQQTIKFRLGEFETLLHSIIDNPELSIAKLPLLPQIEKDLLNQWNNTKTDYPHLCIHELFEAQVKVNPSAIAVIFDGETLTYQELNEKANQLANYLRKLGVKADSLVGISLERSLLMVISLVAILKAGGAYVPIDPTYPKERKQLILEDSQLSILLTEAKHLATMPTFEGEIIPVDRETEIFTQESKENLETITNHKNLAYIVYTSGSTGKPKGVSAIHQGVVRLVKATNYLKFDPQQVFLQLAPLSFDASTLEVWGALLNGGKLVVYPAVSPTLGDLGQFIQKHQISTLWLTAGLFHLMVDEQMEQLSHVSHLLAGGDVLSVPQVQKCLQNLKQGVLINGYGPTENTTFTCCYQIDSQTKFETSIPIGKAIANTQVYILDRYLNQVPIGVPGELYIGGDGLARGYLNRPELTAEKFIPNPFSQEPDDRLYQSGDWVRFLPDGNIEFLGRIDFQVKIRGFRIELGEIETTLLTHPKVGKAVVMAQEDTNQEKILVAYFIASEGITDQTEDLVTEIKEFLKAKLPEFMLPAFVIKMEDFPLNQNGKVDRKALPKPETLRAEMTANLVLPRNEIEEKIAQVWQEVLRLEKVGIHNNFFELGGHSLIGTKMIARLSKIFEINFPLKTLFEVPTIAQLAQRIETITLINQATQVSSTPLNEDEEEGEL